MEVWKIIASILKQLNISMVMNGFLPRIYKTKTCWKSLSHTLRPDTVLKKPLIRGMINERRRRRWYYTNWYIDRIIKQRTGMNGQFEFPPLELSSDRIITNGTEKYVEIIVKIRSAITQIHPTTFKLTIY